MAVGYPVTKADVDNQAGALVAQLWQDLDAVRRFKAWLDDSTHNDTFLTNLGYGAGDITVLRAAFTDMDNLRKISHAAGTQATVNDFFFNAKALTGTTYTG